MTLPEEQDKTPANATDWAAFRSQFPVTERAVYLNTGWSGPSARRVAEAMRRRVEREAYDGPTTLEVRHEKALLVREARAALAGLIGAGDVALMYTTTQGINAVLSGLGLGPGDEVLTCDLEHPAVMVPCYELRRRTGVHVTVLRTSGGETAEELARLFEEAITPRTRLLVVSHISYSRGTKLPIERLVGAAHESGALVLVDGAQAAGQIPIDVVALDVDFYSFPGHKYVMGPDGVGALYVRPELVERVQPQAVAHGAAEAYDFEGGFTPRLASMRKFEMSTNSGPLLAGAIEAGKLIRETGVPTIAARIRELAARLIAGLHDIPGATLGTPLDPPLRSGLVTFAVEDQNPHETSAALWQLRKVVARVVNDERVRLSAAAFNNEADIDAGLAAVEELATRGLPPGSMSADEYKALVEEDDD